MVIICGCWPPSGPPAAKIKFFDLYVDVGPLESLRRQKVEYSFFIFTLLLNAF